ncbi:MAG: hypothetical protein LBN11_06430, partial [Tannerella sp.]|nr:hypothetical protein [Tannerella sp.]
MRRTILTLTLVIGAAIQMFAQDLIILKNGDEIKAVVTEVEETKVKYKKASNESGPTYSIDISKIFKIKYDNGDEEFFGKKNDEPTTEGVRRRRISDEPIPDPETPRTSLNSGSNSRQPVNRQTQLNSGRNVRANYDDRQNYDNYDIEEPRFKRVYVGLDIGGGALISDNNGMESSGLHFALDFGVLFNKTTIDMTPDLANIFFDSDSGIEARLQGSPFLFLDFTYVEMKVGVEFGKGKSMYTNFGGLLKFPVALNDAITLYPLAGINHY